MKCWWKFFHNWTKWSQPQCRIALRASAFGDEEITGMIQERKCQDCGKYAWRWV